MILLLTVLAAAATGTALAAATVARALARRYHHCRTRSLPATCERCAAVLDGQDRGGHVVCDCGQVSPHLIGSDLLRWRADHHGESLPALPGERAGVPTAGSDATADATHDATTGATVEQETPSKPSTTRGRAAAEAGERARRALDEELSETQRRMIDRARRRPDPITPQLLREAEDLGIRRADPEPATEPAEDAANVPELPQQP